MNHDPLVGLIRILKAIESGILPCFDDRAFLVEGVRKSLLTGEPIEIAMGFTSHGERPASTRLAMARRNLFLYCAVRNVPVKSPLKASYWSRCKALSPLLKNYQACSLRHDLNSGNPISGSAWKIDVFHAAEMTPGRPLPSSPEMLYEIVKEVRDNSSQGGWATMAGFLATPLQPACQPLNASPSSALSALP